MRHLVNQASIGRRLALTLAVAGSVGLSSSDALAKPHSAATVTVALKVVEAFQSVLAQARQPWTHPVAGIERRLPDTQGGHFGAERPNRTAPECGKGHCGVDLYGERGAPVLSIQAGKVLRVVRDPGKSSGRYVAIEHADGLRSYYMHLDAVRDDLRAGMTVRAGECIGTLGTSGIRHSEPHLHFAVSRMRRAGERYENPEPKLADARVVHAFERIGL